MPKEFEAQTLVEATIGVAAHLEFELEEALAEHQLTRASFLVLAALERADDNTLNQRELVARVRRTSGTMSVRLGRLEHAGVITRRRDPENGRSVTVTLTERGLQLVQEALPTYRDRAERLVSALSPDARTSLAEHVPAWLAFFEPDERLAPRLGVAVAPSAVAARMRRAVGLTHEHGVLILRVEPEQPCRPGRLLARRSRRAGRRHAGAQHRRPRARGAQRRVRGEGQRAPRAPSRASSPSTSTERCRWNTTPRPRRRSTPTRARSSTWPRV